MTEMLLIRAPYPYGKPQIWLPLDLMKAASQLEHAGVRTDIKDMNIEKLPGLERYDYVGIGVTGAPYIPVTRKISENLLSKGKKVMLGGPGVEHLGRGEFERIYGKEPLQVKTDADLAKAVGVEKIPEVYRAGISGQLDKLSPGKIREYLSKEFSFFSSQGCKYSCRFCAAVRNEPGSREKVGEVFSDTITDDIGSISEKSRLAGIDHLKLYVSSLDFLQTPEKMMGVLEEFGKAREKYGIDFDLRGLVRVDSFLEALDRYPELREILPRSGVSTLGFGIDGTADYVWKSQRKGKMSLEEADKAFSSCREIGITPEALMVMGFNNIGDRRGDNRESLRKNLEYSLETKEKYGVVQRPHVAKEFYPGAEGWENPYWENQKQMLLDNPEFFKNLDFVAYASEITHPDPSFREEVNRTYDEIIKLSADKCTTSPLMPYKLNGKEWNFYADLFNRNSTFDR